MRELRCSREVRQKSAIWEWRLWLALSAEGSQSAASLDPACASIPQYSCFLCFLFPSCCAFLSSWNHPDPFFMASCILLLRTVLQTVTLPRGPCNLCVSFISPLSLHELISILWLQTQPISWQLSNITRIL